MQRDLFFPLFLSLLVNKYPAPTHCIYGDVKLNPYEEIYLHNLFPFSACMICAVEMRTRLWHSEALMAQRKDEDVCLCARCLHLEKMAQVVPGLCEKGSRNVSSLNQYSPATIWLYWCFCGKVAAGRWWDVENESKCQPSSFPLQLILRHFCHL